MRDRVNEAIWVEARLRWQLNVQRDGERRTFTCPTPGSKGKIACEKKADRWLDDQLKNDVRFEVFWPLFLEDTKARTGIANYVKVEQIGRTWLLPIVQRKRLSKITEQDWQRCLNAAFMAGRARKTIKNISGVITSVCKFARKDKRPLSRPEELTIPQGAPVGERKIIQPDQVTKVFSVSTSPYYGKPREEFYIHAWRFLILTGLRPGELAGVKRVQDIIGEKLGIKRAYNQHGETTQGKNDNARREQLLSHYAVQVMADQEAMLKAYGIISPWAFPAPDGSQMETKHLYARWKVYSRQFGITCSVYEMRHTMISIMKSDMPKALLKRLVGHSNTMDTYGVYGHNVDGDLEHARSILDGVFGTILK